jgi:tape measure domain-containing protein
MPDFAVTTAFRGTDKLSPVFNKMGNSADKFGNKATKSFKKVDNASSKMMSSIKGLLPAVSVAMAGVFVNASVEAAAGMERLETAFKSVFGKESANEINFVRKEVKRLGLDLIASADAYKSIAAAAKGSAISNEMVKEVFLGVSEGAAALQLTSEQTSGALTALSQMISKGKVQAEELRGQLGERIPGAFQIASRAMNMTTAELDKFMSEGKLTAELFIPRFAAQMRKEFGGAAMDAANSFTASQNRFKVLILDFKVGIGKIMLPLLSDLMAAFSPVIKAIGDFFRENKEGITKVIKLIPFLVGGFVAFKIAMLGVLAVQKVMIAIGWIKYLIMMRTHIWKAIKMTKLWAVAQKILNVIMSMNPIGLIIIAIAALIGYIVIAIKNWKKFGAAMMILIGPIGKIVSLFKTLYDRWTKIKNAFTSKGIIAALKQIGLAIVDAMIYPFQQLLEVLSNIPGVGEYIGRGARALQSFRERYLGAEKQKSKTSRKVKTSSREFEMRAPNEAEARARKIDFKGRIDIAGAPRGTEVDSQTTGAPAILLQLLGAQ